MKLEWFTYLDAIMQRLKAKGFLPSIEKVGYEFQKGGDEMLKIR